MDELTLTPRRWLPVAKAYILAISLSKVFEELPKQEILTLLKTWAFFLVRCRAASSIIVSSTTIVKVLNSLNCESLNSQSCLNDWTLFKPESPKLLEFSNAPKRELFELSKLSNVPKLQFSSDITLVLEDKFNIKETKGESTHSQTHF